MSDHVLRTIELVQAQIVELDRQLSEKKRMVNDLSKLAGGDAVYLDADLTIRSASFSIRPDEYYGKAQATVVRMVLERRQAANMGAATVNEIYDEMVRGGYNFGGKNEENNKRGLYISLGKNTTAFHKLPNGTYGLREWYPDLREPKKNGGTEKPLHEELQEEAAKEEDTAPVKVAK